MLRAKHSRLVILHLRVRFRTERIFPIFWLAYDLENSHNRMGVFCATYSPLFLSNRKTNTDKKSSAGGQNLTRKCKLTKDLGTVIILYNRDKTVFVYR